MSENIKISGDGVAERPSLEHIESEQGQRQLAALSKMRKGIGSHQSANMLKDEWLTPPYILEMLGDFDLDPCAPVSPPWPTARKHYTVFDDGLSKPWSGRVWLNPPYGKQTGEWLARLAAHGNGMALIFARTETAMFVEQVWGKASAVLFIAGRLHFHHVCGTRAKANSGAPSVLVAYGDDCANRLKDSGIAGQFLHLQPPKQEVSDE